MKATLSRLFRRPTPAELAARELAEAELQLLSAHTAKEYAESVIQYNESRLTRLRMFLADV